MEFERMTHMERRTYMKALAGSVPAVAVSGCIGETSFNWHGAEKQLYEVSDGYRLDIILTVSTESDDRGGLFYSNLKILDESEELIYVDSEFEFSAPMTGKTRVRKQFSTSDSMSLKTMRDIHQNQVPIYIYFDATITRGKRIYKIQN